MLNDKLDKEKKSNLECFEVFFKEVMRNCMTEIFICIFLTTFEFFSLHLIKTVKKKGFIFIFWKF